MKCIICGEEVRLVGPADDPLGQLAVCDNEDCIAYQCYQLPDDDNEDSQ
jgi:hypothetical protein